MAQHSQRTMSHQSDSSKAQLQLEYLDGLPKNKSNTLDTPIRMDSFSLSSYASVVLLRIKYGD